MNEKILIYDFGSQYTQLIARRVRECGVYSEILPYHSKSPIGPEVKAIILSGSPFSVNDDNAPDFDFDRFSSNIPVLAICYGAQLISKKYGGTVMKTNKREYGKAVLNSVHSDKLFQDITEPYQVWMSHSDSITRIPIDFHLLASTSDIPVAAFKKTGQQDIYCLQFHPEVTHSLIGKQIIENFVHRIAECSSDWTSEVFIETAIDEIREKVGEDHVLLGLSGGVDSTVAATLLHRAVGDQLLCFFIDNGLLRKDEFKQVMKSYESMGLNVIGLDCGDLFLKELAGVKDPETKRKIIGRVFIEVFEKHAKQHPEIKWLAQGTIYPDVIESISVHGPSVTIKSHHNVGGLPEKLHLKIIEPLRLLFKDEVRKIGAALEVPDNILNRHPFPGPGLGIRILGDVTAEKVNMLQEADAIYISHLMESGWYDKVWQAGTILLPVQSVGVMGDERTYELTVALRAVSSTDGMTAEWSHLPYDLLASISTDIINQVKGINRVVYDISNKPPATIEWE